MRKVHLKNGFNYKHTKYNYAGTWSYTWYIKPVDAEIYLVYAKPLAFNTRKADVEEWLSNPEEARTKYYEDLARQSDVNRAEKELEYAQSHYQKVMSPDFDIRGNNPNAESRARKNAKSQLESAEQRVRTAKEYHAILSGKLSNQSEC
ncbi:hypothetical protein JN652_003567 [Vibrio cholerae]|nr:hypothetical protein [Vibrio cholerae]